MGIYNRDYYRRSTFGDQIPPVCKALIMANVVVFLLQIFITRPITQGDLKAAAEQDRAERDRLLHRERKPSSKNDTHSPTKTPSDAPDAKAKPSDNDDAPREEADQDGESLALAGLPRVSVVEEWFQLKSSAVVYKGQIWRLITSAFCHDRFSIMHILFNMLFLYYFGRMLEPLYGSKEFLLFYLTAAVVASLCYIGLDLFTREDIPAIGASGAVMAVVVLYAILHPRERFYFFWGMFPIEIRWLVIFYIIFDLHPVLLALAGMPKYTGVANAAHLGGAAFGYLYWRFRWRLEDTWDRVESRARVWQASFQRRARLYAPPDESVRSGTSDGGARSGVSKEKEMDDLIDDVLRKLYDQGESSLTNAERDVLKRAAERYRK